MVGYIKPKYNDFRQKKVNINIYISKYSLPHRARTE